MTKIIYVLPNLEKVVEGRGNIRYCIDYLTKEGENEIETKFEFFDDEEQAIKRYNELVRLSLVKNF